MNEALLRRLGGGNAHGLRGRDADRRAGASKRGADLVAHFLARDSAKLLALAQDLDPRRRHVRLLDLSPVELEARLVSHCECLPADLVLRIRFSARYDCPLDASALKRLRPRACFGTPERDVGPFPLIQVADLAAPENRVRIGRLTALTRAALTAAKIARQFTQEASQ